MMLCTWLRQAVPVLDAAYPGLPAAPISIGVAFAEIVGVTRGRPTAKDAEELRSLVLVTSHAGKAEIAVEIRTGFDDGLFQPDNIADRVLVEAIVGGVAVAAGGGADAQKCRDLLAAICPNAQMRHVHRFEAQTFRDYLRAEIGRKPLHVNEFDHAACLIELGWRHRPRELGPEISGVLECTSYLNEVVAILLEEICQVLRKLDRREVVKELLLSHESASCDRDAWRRTAQANLAMHSDTSEALRTIVENEGRLGVSSAMARILIEAALCECPLEGGAMPGKLDLSRLISRAYLAFSFGGDSDAVRWGAMEPWIKVTPLGDIHMSRTFEKEVYSEFVRAGGAVQVEYAVEGYQALYDSPPAERSVEGVIDTRFLGAWRCEFGVPVDGMRAFIDGLERIGIERNEVIVTMRRSALVALLAEAGSISEQKASDALALITLESRPQWQMAPSGFNNRDWQPWRFRRRLSVLRRPLLQIDASGDPEILFAPGFVREAFIATLRWFHEGGIRPSETISSEMESWIGQANAEAGHEFNEAVEERLKALGWHTKREMALTDAAFPTA